MLRMKNRFITILLAVIFALTSIPQVAFAKNLTEDLEVLYISTADEFMKFTSKCYVDKWSRNIKVVLNKDIDLSKQDFKGVPYFAGYFDGNNHTISGINIKGDGYITGFFRYLDEEALVENLKISGNISSAGDKLNVGGIVGINFGELSKCTFSGNVQGKMYVGGIAALNEESGKIDGCIFTGNLVGNYYVGGITGKNLGELFLCENKGNVNSDDSWLDTDKDSNKGLSVDSILKSQREKVVIGTDIGGIAGVSEGIIESCYNQGIVGYEHSGYNIGGIVGRQNGQIYNCKNNGPVYGRKDVGGIVGQLEPYVEVEDTESLADAMQTLHDLIDKTINDAKGASDSFTNKMDDINYYSNAALDDTKSIVDQTENFVDTNMDVANDLSGRIDTVIDMLPNVLDRFSGVTNNVDKMTKKLKDVANDLNVVDKMKKNKDSVVAYSNLKLTNGINGVMTSNIASPSEGNSVTVTINPQNGYEIKSLTMVNYDNNNNKTDSKDITSQVNNNEYTFVMPAGKVELLAVYNYTGEYVPSSNEGGKLLVESLGNSVKFRVITAAGYKLKDNAIYVDGRKYDYSEDMTLDKIKSNSPIVCSAEFEKASDAYMITTVSSTGGTVTTDKGSANEGEKITATVVVENGYKLKEIKVNGGLVELSNTEADSKYSFDMPAKDVKVEAAFEYNNLSADSVYTESNVGGSVVCVSELANTNYIITMVPSTGYNIAEDSAISIEGSSATKKLKKSDLSAFQNGSYYTYTFDSSIYGKPIKITGKFIEDKSSVNIKKEIGTGGLVEVDKLNINAGDTLNVTVVKDDGYMLNKLTFNGEDITSNVKDSKVTVKVPDSQDKDVVFTASFVPVYMVLSSENAGGIATRLISENGKSNITLKLEDGYVVDGTPTLKINDKELSLSKLNASGNIYYFDVSEEMKNPSTPARFNVKFIKQSSFNSTQDAKERITKNSQTLTNSMNSATDSLNDMKKLLTNADGSRKEAKDLTDEESKRLYDDLSKSLDYLTQSGNALTEIVSDLTLVVNTTLPYIETGSVDAVNDLKDALDYLEKVNKDIDDAITGIDDIVKYLDRQPKITFKKLGDEFHNKTDSLYNNLKEISDIMKTFNSDTHYYSDLITADLQAVNDQLNEVVQLFINKLDNLEDLGIGKDFYTDVSKENAENDKASRVKECSNYGKIDADRNVGGIAGAVGVDSIDADEENEAKSANFIGSKWYAMTVLEDCRNEGFITIKKENGGGIAGYSSMGLFRNDIALGSIDSADGKYIGGVLGKSEGSIDSCYSLAKLSGVDYVGGIAGVASNISNCVSMATISEATSRIGAIAGEIVVDKEAAFGHYQDTVYDNYYLSSTLYGINGVSYENIAQAASYEEIISMESIPVDFSKLKIIFVDEEGSIVKEMYINYGVDISNIEMPKLTSKNDTYGKWTELPSKTMQSNIIVKAEYYDDITTLSSEEKNDKGKYLGYADGVFTDSAIMNVKEVILKHPDASNKEVLSYEITFANTKLYSDSNTKVRILAPTGKVKKLYTFEADKFNQIEFRQVGKYIEFELHGVDATVSITYTKPLTLVQIILIIVVCVVVVAVIIALVLILKKKMKKKK